MLNFKPANLDTYLNWSLDKTYTETGVIGQGLVAGCAANSVAIFNLMKS